LPKASPKENRLTAVQHQRCIMLMSTKHEIITSVFQPNFNVFLTANYI